MARAKRKATKSAPKGSTKKRRPPALEIEDYVEIIGRRYTGCIGYVDDFDHEDRPVVVILRMRSGDLSPGGYVYAILPKNLRRLTDREVAALKIDPGELVDAMVDPETKAKADAKYGGGGQQ